MAYLPVIKKGALDWLVLAPFPFLSVLFSVGISVLSDLLLPRKNLYNRIVALVVTSVLKYIGSVYSNSMH